MQKSILCLLGLSAMSAAAFSATEYLPTTILDKQAVPSVKQAWEETAITNPATTDPVMASALSMSMTEQRADNNQADNNQKKAQEGMQAHAQDEQLLHLEERIGWAIVNQEWTVLQTALADYQKLPNFDEILVAYAKGAMFRKQGQQKQAIAQYQTIINQRHDLPYVKFDLALMLFEDKQYRQAGQLLDELLTSQTLSAPMQTIATHVRQTITKSQAWQPSVSLNYESTQNVNNASAIPEIVWLGKRWQKQADSLPQSAQGVRYDLSLQKDTNIHANHFAMMNVDIEGVRYFDRPEYDEVAARLAVGYKYHDVARSWRVLPFVEQSWLNNKKYNATVGLSTTYGQNINDKNYMQLYAAYHKKYYHDPRIANNYDGQLFSLNATLNHRINESSLVYGGIDGTIDDVKSPEHSSKRWGGRVGLMHTFASGLGLNANVRYGQRHFDAPSTLVYDFVRHDDEYQGGLSVWHNKFHVYGLRPQFNIRYVKIDSNMPAFYSRDGWSYFVSVDKVF